MAANPQDLQKLDELLAIIDRCAPADEVESAHEHVHEARTYLLGGMPDEFKWSLEFARETLKRMDKTEARLKAEKVLASLSKN